MSITTKTIRANETVTLTITVQKEGVNITQSSNVTIDVSASAGDLSIVSKDRYTYKAPAFKTEARIEAWVNDGNCKVYKAITVAVYVPN